MSSLPDALGNVVTPPKLQRVCCLALCGIHLGPVRYLSSSSFVQPYIQVRCPLLRYLGCVTDRHLPTMAFFPIIKYFESSAARELFEFQVC